MKTIRNFILLAAVALLGAVACSKPAPLSLKDATVQVPAEGMEYDLNFNATVDWTSVVSEKWLSINPVSGNAGDVKAKVTVAANAVAYPRTATVVVTAGSASATITFEQARPDDHEKFNAPDDYKW